jgi:uncharacterized protein (DUF1015 family)
MCVCVDADHEEIVVLPYNRVVRGATDAEDLTRLARERFGARSISVEDAPAFVASASADHVFAIVLADEALVIELSDADIQKRLAGHAAAWRNLSVVVLHEVVLPELFPKGIEDLAFSRDASEVHALVAQEGWTAGILLKAVQPSEIVDVAASGERMPQKASYFWPKAITGLVFHSLS